MTLGLFGLLRFVAIGAVALAAPIAFAPSPPGAAARDLERSLTRPGVLSHYAFVEERTTARARPSPKAKPLARLTPTTYWGTSTLVLALSRTGGLESRSWTKVRLPESPHDATAWVRTEALSSLQAVHTWLRIDRKRFTATLIRNRRAVFRAPIGVGLPQWPTPAGEYVIEVRITPTEADTAYGAMAFGTSAHSSVLTEWPNNGQVGIHGTNEPWLIPGRVSHGCIRLRNRDILRLARLMPVGTPVTIR